jgi:Zn-dependent peptidase ImmA (M78 family)/transcriptional regulator with XRE-family HTH domain
MSRGVQDFKPERLKQALAARKFSQGQLATLVGVSAATISKWRSGDQSPEADTLDRLADKLSLASEWFTRPLLGAPLAPMYRSNAQALASARSKLEARMEWAQEIAMKLGEFASYPSVKIPARSFTDPDQISAADIEEAAQECRDLWCLGRSPVQDLALAVESAGVIFVREETEISSIEGLSSWSEVLERPIILLSADKANAFRSRFDLAHEVAHIVLHRYIPPATERARYKQIEKQAHQFAGAFLLPAETFVSGIQVPVTLDNLLILKQRWGVSVAAMLMRLETLGIIDADDKLSLFKRRSARWGAKSEPGDDKRIPEQPRLLRRTIDLIISSGVMPAPAIPRHLGLSPRDVEALAGLREGFFDGSAEVIELATLRIPSKAKNDIADQPKSSGSVIQFSRRNSE